MEQAIWRRGAVSVYLGDKSGKYPDGNQVTVRGADTLVAFDTPLSANRLGPEFTDADLVILGHVHEDHMAALHRVPKAKVVAHEADVEAARSWEGLSRHYGYADEVLRPFKGKIEREFFYAPRPDAKAPIIVGDECLDLDLGDFGPRIKNIKHPLGLQRWNEEAVPDVHRIEW